jgi:hypothetical protein
MSIPEMSDENINISGRVSQESCRDNEWKQVKVKKANDKRMLSASTL